MTSHPPGLTSRGTSAPIDAVRAAAYEIPTDQPESDGTLSWTSTVLVVAEVSAGGVTGLGYTYAHQAAVPLIEQKLASVLHGRDAFAVRTASPLRRRADARAGWRAATRSEPGGARPGVQAQRR